MAIQDEYITIEMKDLVGRKIEKIEIGSKCEHLNFHTDDGALTFATWGDCCSTSRVIGIENPECLIGNTITKLKHIAYKDIPAKYSKVEYHEDQGDGSIAPHAIELITNKGSCKIFVNNYSNGYYDGGISKFAGDVAELTEWFSDTNQAKPIIWNNITKDWFGYGER